MGLTLPVFLTAMVLPILPAFRPLLKAQVRSHQLIGNVTYLYPFVNSVYMLLFMQLAFRSLSRLEDLLMAAEYKCEETIPFHISFDCTTFGIVCVYAFYVLASKYDMVCVP